ncbi:MAG: hypothetical protein O7J95_06465 [Planctomycetota bacterium]|nr:hypothetical protein [Planctomycetota bacterium]
MPDTAIDVKKPARLGRALAVTRALGTLFLVAAGVWGVSRLGELDPPPPRVHGFEGPRGTQVWWIERPGGRDAALRDLRIVVSRVTLEEPSGAVLRIREGGRRVLPPHGLTLVHRDSRLEVLPMNVEVRRLFGRLRRSRPRESLERWFGRPEQLELADVDFGSFWE